MRFFLAGGLIHLFYAAAYGILPLPLAAISDSDKPLTEYTHTVWTHKEGLPSAFIYSIAQTEDGYLWLATTDGLVRFDGVRFVHWRPKTGHKELLGAVRTLRAARDGSLWLGTASGLVGHIQGDHLTTSSVESQVEAILEDQDGTLWVRTANRVLRLRAATQEQIGSVIELRGLLSGPVQDNSGFIWLSTDAGVFRLDPRDDRNHPEEITKGKLLLSGDTHRTVYMTRSDGLTQPVDSKQLLDRVDTSQTLKVQTVLRDSEGNMWIGTLGQGLVRLRADSGDVQKPEKFSQRDGLSAEFVWCLLEDREHNIWVGTQNGLNRFRDEKITTLTRREGLASDSIDALAAGPDGTIWASTSTGIRRIDGENRNVYLKGERVMGLLIDAGNGLWAGTNRGVVHEEDGKWSNPTIPLGVHLQDVTVLTEDREKGVWLVDSHKGLYRWSDGRITDFSAEVLLKGKSILAASAGNRGGVWFGVDDGRVVGFESGEFHSYSEHEGLPGGALNAVHVDDDGMVWVATERGLARLEGERFVTWNSTSGLPGDRVLWVLSDRAGRIWLGYSTGVACVDRSELGWAERDHTHRVSYNFYDDGDGLKGNPSGGWQSPAVQASDGKLWFRTSEGVAILDPAQLKKNFVAPPVYIEQLVADGGVADNEKKILLRPLSRNIQIDYTALSFAEPRKVRFRYKLEGFDSDWRDAGIRRQAFYTNLPPRGYRFQVQACNNDGVWSESAASLDFDLLPAFYQTQWFRLVCILSVVLLAWGAYLLRVRQVSRSLRERYEERSKERTRIAQELHDSLIQDVMGISLQMELTDELLPAGLPAKQPLARALGLSRSALDQGRRALNELRRVSLSSSDLIKAFSGLRDEFGRDAETTMDMIVEGCERPLAAVTGYELMQVGRQAITNALQHAHARRIHVLLSYGEQFFEMRIQDNGCGINEDTLNLGRPGHYGIAGMKERAERLGGSIAIRSRVGEGTEIDVTVAKNLLYADEMSRSDWRFGHKWRHVLEMLGTRRTKASRGGLRKDEPNETNS